MYRSVSTSRVSDNYYFNNNSTSALSSPKASPAVRALSLEANEVPLYEPVLLSSSSEISKKEKKTTRRQFAENAVHFIPFVLLSCAFILWFFSNPAEVDVGMKGSSIAARIEGLTIEGDVDSDGTLSARTLPAAFELGGDVDLPNTYKLHHDRRVFTATH